MFVVIAVDGFVSQANSATTIDDSLLNTWTVSEIKSSVRQDIVGGFRLTNDKLKIIPFHASEHLPLIYVSFKIIVVFKYKHRV